MASTTFNFVVFGFLCLSILLGGVSSAASLVTTAEDNCDYDHFDQCHSYNVSAGWKAVEWTGEDGIPKPPNNRSYYLALNGTDIPEQGDSSITILMPISGSPTVGNLSVSLGAFYINNVTSPANQSTTIQLMRIILETGSEGLDYYMNVSSPYSGLFWETKEFNFTKPSTGTHYYLRLTFFSAAKYHIERIVINYIDIQTEATQTKKKGIQLNIAPLFVVIGAACAQLRRCCNRRKQQDQKASDEDDPLAKTNLVTTV